jgi:hypothetical protein
MFLVLAGKVSKCFLRNLLRNLKMGMKAKILGFHPVMNPALNQIILSESFQ